MGTWESCPYRPNSPICTSPRPRSHREPAVSIRRIQEPLPRLRESGSRRIRPRVSAYLQAVIYLMAALKRSLAEQVSAKCAGADKKKRAEGEAFCVCRSSGITGSAPKRAGQPTSVTKNGFGVIGTMPNFGWNGKSASPDQGLTGW
jgi:hypothetical protein